VHAVTEDVALRSTRARRGRFADRQTPEFLRGLGRTAVSGLLFALPFAGPAAIFAYLVGLYHPHPGTIDGKYFPDGGFLFDLHVMWKAGHDVVTGHSPYPFVYPAPAVILMVPFGVLPWKAAVVAFTIVLVAAMILALRLLGIRDWRCYGAALASVPMFGSLAVGSLSPLLVLAAAMAWRYRDRRFVVAAAIAGAVVTKIFLWPLLVWLVATRRVRSAATTIVLGVVTVFGCWAMIGFAGLRGYPHQVGHVAGLEQYQSYSGLALAHSLGLSHTAARLAMLAVGACVLVAIAFVARQGDGDRRAFVLAIGAALLLSPIVWMHYLLLLFVPIALYQRRFGLAWALPLLYWLWGGQQSDGSLAVILWVLAVAILSVALTGRVPDSLRRRPAPAA